MTSEIEIVSEESTEEVNTDTTEITSEESTEEISTEEILEVESLDTTSEIVMETIVYTTDPMVVPCLQIIICFLGAFAIFWVCKFVYRILDFIF